MIIAHALIGLMPVANKKFSWFWLVGSVIPDVDHLFVIYYYRLFSFKRLIDAERFEDKYGIHFKTKYGHSIFGAVMFSIPAVLINRSGGVYFFLAYLLHLLMDWPDRDEKQYFYPFKLKVRGFLPIFSKWEIGFTFVLILILFRVYFRV
jgi:hypothetical protein